MYIRRNGDLIFPKQNGYWVVKTKIVHFLFYCLVFYYSSYFYDSKVKRRGCLKTLFEAVFFFFVIIFGQ